MLKKSKTFSLFEDIPLRPRYCYKIYQNRARAIYLISDKNIIDTKRKNQLIVKITEKIVYYNKMIEDEQKKINKSERK